MLFVIEFVDSKGSIGRWYVVNEMKWSNVPPDMINIVLNTSQFEYSSNIYFFLFFSFYHITHLSYLLLISLISFYLSECKIEIIEYVKNHFSYMNMMIGV